VRFVLDGFRYHGIRDHGQQCASGYRVHSCDDPKRGISKRYSYR
jgi:hypothetical protein